jgi:hypothetical protein
VPLQAKRVSEQLICELRDTTDEVIEIWAAGRTTVAAIRNADTDKLDAMAERFCSIERTLERSPAGARSTRWSTTFNWAAAGRRTCFNLSNDQRSVSDDVVDAQIADLSRHRWAPSR